MTSEGIASDLAQVDGNQHGIERVAAQARQVEEVADQPFEPLRLALDHLSCAVWFDHAVAQSFGVTANRSQRRLQLVADREEKRALRVLSVAKFLGQVVERRGKLPQLHRPVDGQWLGVLSLGEPPARGCGAAHRARDGACEQESDPGGECCRNQCGDCEPDEKWAPVGRLVSGRPQEDDRVSSRHAGGVEKGCSADVDRAGGTTVPSQSNRIGLWQQQLGLLWGQDGEPFVLGRKKATDFRVLSGQRARDVLGGDQVDLPAE